MKTLYKRLRYSALIFALSASVLSCSFKGFGKWDFNIISSGTITDRNIGEASGIAASRVNGDIIWVINDSGNRPSVFALDSSGKHILTLDIQGVANNDWEDMASFEYRGKPYILIADVGDNFARRSKCFLHFIEEPDISRFRDSSPSALKPSWSITFTYEDGPRDCEAVAVDIINEKVILLTKRDQPPVLYELPLKADKEVVAKRLAEIRPLPFRPSGSAESPSYSNQPTAMDISANGLSAVVLSYGSAFYFSRKKSKEWTAVFSGTSKEIIFPLLKQAESACFSRDGSAVFITSEQLPAPLFKIELKN